MLLPVGIDDFSQVLPSFESSPLPAGLPKQAPLSLTKGGCDSGEIWLARGPLWETSEESHWEDRSGGGLTATRGGTSLTSKVDS